MRVAGTMQMRRRENQQHETHDEDAQHENEDRADVLEGTHDAGKVRHEEASSMKKMGAAQLSKYTKVRYVNIEGRKMRNVCKRQMLDDSGYRCSENRTMETASAFCT